MMQMRRMSLVALLGVCAAACSGGGDGGGGGTPPPPPPPPPATYTIGGTVSGLEGTGLVLRNNGGDDLTVSANGSITFATSVASGAAYAVTVRTVPTVTPAQTCEVSSGAGTVANAAVTSVVVACRTMTGRYVYVANTGSNNVSAFSITPTTGALTAVTGSPFPVSGDPPRIVMSDRSGKFVYVIGAVTLGGASTVSGYTIDAATGALTAIAGFPLSFPVNVLIGAFHPTGTLFYMPVSAGVNSPSNGLYGYRVDPTTGTFTAVPGSPYRLGSLSNGPPGFAIFNATGEFLYVPNNSAGELMTYAVNTATGALTAIGPTLIGTSVNRTIVDPSGKFLYTRNANSTTSAFVINDATGALTSSGSVPTGVGSGVVFGPAGRYVYFDVLGFIFPPPTFPPTPPAPVYGPGSVHAFRIDPVTGGLSELAGSPHYTGGNTAIAIAIDARTKYVALTNVEQGGAAPPTIAVFGVDSTNGTLSHVPGSPFLPPTDTTRGAVIFDPSGRYAYVSDNGGDSVVAYRIDEAAGAPVLIGTYPTGDMPTGFMQVVGRQ
jgi:6-phosphogluconolactonase (cycloisomerase 2 family)